MRSAYRKNGDKDFAFCFDCLGDNFTRFDGRFAQRAMVPIAVRGFHEHNVSLAELDRVAMQRRPARTKIAGENDALRFTFLLNNKLDGG